MQQISKSQTFSKKAYACENIFDGDAILTKRALIIEDNIIVGIESLECISDQIQLVDLGEGHLLPGFVDLQVNGGDGILLGEALDVDDIQRLCRSHMYTGTTALSPTLITDTKENTERVLNLSIEAARQKVPGFLGLHLEGPHLSKEKCGAHDADLIRPMTVRDVELYKYAAGELPNLIITIAPEYVPAEQIKELVGAGVRISLGHSNATFAQCKQAAEAGATLVTHLYNAMSGLQHREPGLVGAALDLSALSAGLIADGHHVDPAAIRVALSAKKSPTEIFLVTDSMSQTGTDLSAFLLGGREVTRQGGRLQLTDGTLAGADINMPQAIKYLVEGVGVPATQAFSMATSIPAAVLNVKEGRLCKGHTANFVHLSNSLEVKNVWMNGQELNLI